LKKNTKNKEESRRIKIEKFKICLYKAGVAYVGAYLDLRGLHLPSSTTSRFDSSETRKERKYFKVKIL